MLWVKAFHLIAVVAWFAGLFYLPRLFVYHAMTEDQPGRERFKVMERKLYRAIMTPAAVVTVGLGLWLLYGYAWAAFRHQGWLHAKLLLTLILVGYHLYCGKIMRDFAADANRRSHIWFRYFNEVPTLILVAVVVLVIVKPF